MREQRDIEAGIAALEAQRGIVSDAVLELALAPLREKLIQLREQAGVGGQQLRQVSVLFVDVVGSTAMGQGLEPEDIHAVMDGALGRFTDVVLAHRGRVLQYTGDGMLAVFGAEEAHEDDAESAIRAGLGVIGESRQVAPEVRRTHGVPDFTVRAGIHTGTVLLGGGVVADANIRGATVNVAARMEQTAPPGGLRISHETYRHVRGVFEVAEQPAIAVKGIDEPVRSYLVERARPRALRVAARGIEGVETRMVGRDAELSRLSAAFDEVIASHSLRAVTVVGDAGLGKSRLLGAFRDALEIHAQKARLLLGRSQPRSALQAFGLLRDLVAWWLDIDDDDTAEVARRKLVAGLKPLFPSEGEAAAHLLGHLIGLDFSASPHVKEILGDARQIRERGFTAATQVLRRLAASDGAPVVVILDDLHWADDRSLDFVRHVLQALRDVPLLVVMLARPTLFERRAEWAEGDPLHERLDLVALDRSRSQELAKVLLHRINGVPAALRALVTDGAEGNPFYMEELVKMLIDDGVICVEEQGWRVLPDKLLKAHVPSTLTGVLQSRLDALAPQERIALYQAAVVGHVFRDDALAALAPAATTALPALLRKQLIVRRDKASGRGSREYAFQHHLLQQVAYDGVLKDVKRAGHGRVGAFWSARAQVASPQEVTPDACRALLEAHFHCCHSDPQAYVIWFDAQFFNYLNAYAVQTLRPLAEGLVLVCEQQFGDDDPQTAKALTNLSRVILVQGDVENAEPLLHRALATQERNLGLDHPDTARTVAVLGGYFSGRGDWLAAEPFFRRALDIREQALGVEHLLTLDTLDSLAHTVTELGRLDEAEALGRRALEVRERTLGPEHRDTATALTTLGEVLAKKGDFTAAEPLVRRALGIQEKSLPDGHPDTGLSMWHLAETLRGLDRLAEAETLARQTLQIWETALGHEHQWTAWGLSSLAELRLAQGDGAEAAQLAERSLRIHERAFGPGHTVVGATLELLARAHRARGDHVAAEPLLVRALETLQQQSPSDEAAIREVRALLDTTRAVLGRA